MVAKISENVLKAFYLKPTIQKPKNKYIMI